MDILSLSKLFTDLLNQKVYALNFPDFTDGTFIKVEIISGIEESGEVMDFNIQFIVKAEHPSVSERLSIDILNKLNKKTNKDFADGLYQLILIKASSPTPVYIGVTEKGEYLHSTDFRLLVTKI